MNRSVGIVLGLMIALITTDALAQPSAGKGRGGRGGPGGGYSLDNTTLPKDDVEKKIFTSIGKITQEQGFRLNVPTQDGRMLRLLAEGIGAKTVVEIGTSNGISAIWLAMGVRKTGGKVISHEIDRETAKLARENFKTAGVDDMVTVVEGDAHETVKMLKGPIDMVFIDADKEGYADYLKKLLPLVRPGGLICAHNINGRQANPDFVKAATTNPELETVLYSAGAGMSVSLKKR
jgi:caffeoyl-CoA O-methyltransferase